MKIKKILCITMAVATIFSSTQVYASSTSLSMNSYMDGYNYTASLESVVKYYTGQRYYNDDILGALPDQISYEDSENLTVKILDCFGISGAKYNSIPPFSIIKDRLKANKPILATIKWKETGLCSNIVIFSYTESGTDNYIGYINPSDGLKHTMKYDFFCNNSDFELKECIFTSGKLSYKHSNKIDETYNSTNDVGVDNIKEISMKNIENFKECIIAQRESYSLQSNNVFEDITLGAPIEYYSISTAALKENSNAISDNRLKSEGYVLPLKLNGKNIGTAYVKYSQGKWKVDSISNGKLEDIILETKTKDNLKNTKLILDEELEVFGLLDSDSDNKYFVSIYDKYKGFKLTIEKSNAFVSIFDTSSEFKLEKDKRIETKNLLNFIKTEL